MSMIVINDQSNANFNERNEIIYNTEVSTSNLFDYNDAYILVKGNIAIAGRSFATRIAFKNCATFIKCVTKIDGTTIDGAEDLD